MSTRDGPQRHQGAPLAAVFKLIEPQAAKIVRRITGRVRRYARVFELVPTKKA